MKYKMIFFDLDGTLVDSLQDITDAVNGMLRHNGLPVFTGDEVKRYIGKGARNLVEDILEGKGKDVESSLKVFLSHYRMTEMERTSVYEGVRETIKKIDSKKYVLTNKAFEMAKKTLEKLGLAEHFDDIVTPETFGTRKPDPLPILTLSEKYGINLNEIALVGDSIVDIECARNAGVYCVIVSYGYGNTDDLGKADAVVDDFRDILKYL